MTDKNQAITPFRVYNLKDTATILGYHPQTLHELLASNNQTVMAMNPTKIGKEWRFLGENILSALGSVSFSGASMGNSSTVGMATSKNQ